MNEIEKWLTSRIGLNFRSGLDRIKQATRLLDNPEDSFPSIHVTGTNGKGSTIAFMSCLFSGQGKRVGSFTSPHMVNVRDRICINSVPISEEDFIRIGQIIQSMEIDLLKTQDQLSYFEILTLLALLYFKEQQIDLALIEVGIGGLLDTTNIVTGDIAVITSVGLDHQETLGNSIAAITEQKTGIFKTGKKAVIGPLPTIALPICQEKAQELGVMIYEYGRDFSFQSNCFTNHDLVLHEINLGLKGKYQEENAGVALQAFYLMMLEQHWEINPEQISLALSRTHWAGRLEEIKKGIYLDGAHNLPALERLVEFIKEQKNCQSTILFGALKRKDYSQMLDYLQKELPSAHLLVTRFDDPSSLEEAEAGSLPYTDDYRSFMKEFQSRKNPAELLFITGSLYFIAEARDYLMKREKARKE
ncbi:MAG: folylpolyglutamate synthase/dihydrofolate synthase family protein [Streptococcus sp.]|nr:folylpolyglutamate synthase/dihydrofolate synthase family protein [Streptococcus sp.]